MACYAKNQSLSVRSIEVYSKTIVAKQLAVPHASRAHCIPIITDNCT